MQTYIALLRGINVSGQKQIKMADLKAHLEELKFKDVKTYIQSGNIVFQSDLADAKALVEAISNKIKEKYGWDIAVIVKTPKELQDVLEQNPLSDKDLSRLYFTFLADAPSAEKLEKLKDVSFPPEEYLIRGKVIYFYSPNGYGKAKMNNNFFENKLKVAATTRNWKTVEIINKMVELD